MLRRTFTLVAALFAALLPAVSADAAGPSQIAVSAMAPGTTQPYLRLIDPVTKGVSGPFIMTRFSIGGITASPDGGTVAYNGAPASGGYGAYQQDTSGGDPQLAFPLCDGLSWSPLGNEIACWERDNPSGSSTSYTLVAKHPDGTGRRPLLGPVPLSQGGGKLGWSRDGRTLAFVQGGAIKTMPAAGGQVTTVVPASAGQGYGAPSFSPDGSALAFVRRTAATNGYNTELVIHNLSTGGERAVASRQPPEHLGPFEQEWSPDGEKLVFAEDTIPQSGSASNRVVRINADDGGGYEVLFSQVGGQINGIAWGSGAQASYFVKHVEVAQAVGLDIPASNVDPLAADPLDVAWSEPSLGGFSIPLIAGRPTLLRIYPADASLKPGSTATRDIGYRVVPPAPQTPIEGHQTVTVTAPDVAPDQGKPSGAIQVWLPPGVARSGPPEDFSVEINPGQTEAECEGCYPNGNIANVHGVSFRNNGDVTVRPTSITVLDGRVGRRTPSALYGPGLWKDMARVVPVKEDGIKVAPDAASMEVDVSTRGQIDHCDFIIAAYSFLQTIRGPAPATGTGPTLNLGYASPQLPSGPQCNGVSYGYPFDEVVLLSPDALNLAHEFGHNMGLGHVTAANAGGLPPAAGQTALPYPGIGGFGYERRGGATAVYDRTASDLMAYSPSRWVSPFSWSGFFKGIRAQAPGVALHRRITTHGRGAVRAAAARGQARRRLVAGYVSSARGMIITSLVADAKPRRAKGPVMGRVVALNKPGRKVGTAVIRGKALEETPGGRQPGVPFVISLPARAKVAKLILLNSKGKKLNTSRASKRRPVARLKRLPRKVKATRKLRVRWKASDRDSRKLTVLLAARRGRSAWKTVAMTVGGTRHTTVDPRRLGRGGTLRIRVTVTDGFNTTTTLSRTIKVKR